MTKISKIDKSDTWLLLTFIGSELFQLHWQFWNISRTFGSLSNVRAKNQNSFAQNWRSERNFFGYLPKVLKPDKISRKLRTSWLEKVQFNFANMSSDCFLLGIVDIFHCSNQTFMKFDLKQPTNLDFMRWTGEVELQNCILLLELFEFLSVWRFLKNECIEFFNKKNCQ